MIRIQASVSKGWLNKYGGFEFKQQYYFDPLFRMRQDTACHEFIKKRFPDYPIYNMEDNLVQSEHVDQKMMLIGAIQPNLIIAAAIGAEFQFTPDKDSDVKGLPLNNITSLDQLPEVNSVLGLPFIIELAQQISNAQKKYPDYTIIPPFFWDKSGRATIHGIITTSMKFIGQDIFTKMILEPELVKGIHMWITKVYIAVIKFFSELAHIPVTSIHVGECSGTMLDEASYQEFVTPFIDLLGKEFGSVRLHSCGNADHVMESICAIENLAIIDTGSNTSLKHIRKKMGKDFEINVFPPLEVVAANSCENDMKQWLKKTLDDNDGGNLKIEYHLEADYNSDNCAYLHEELDKLGLVKKQRLY